MRELLLELQNINVGYDEETNVLKNLSINIHTKEKIAVLGANGSGKSTFFLTCNGVLPQSKGKILYKGQEILRNKKSLQFLRSRVGLVFQDPDNQIIASTVEGEVSFGPFNLGLSPQTVALRVCAALNAMGLTEYRTRSPHYLSGGEKKRVSIAAILAMEPELILFDEPTSDIDPLGSQGFEETLENLFIDGKTLIVSTHDVNFAWRWADRILVFHNGELIADDIPDVIFSNVKLLSLTHLAPPTLIQVSNILMENGYIDKNAKPIKNIAELSIQVKKNKGLH